MDLVTLKGKIEAGDVDTVLVVFPDVFGRLIGKRLAAHHFLDHVAEGGTHGCNYLLTVNLEMDPLEGFQLANWEKGYGDFAVVPDPGTVRLLPWQQGSAMVICDLRHADGSPVAEAPRSVLRRQVERLSAKGLTCQAASELEFFLYNTTYHDAFASRYGRLEPSSDYRIDYHTLQPARDEPVIGAMRRLMAGARVPVESSKGEWGRGQHELNFVHDQPLPMADGHALFKHGCKEIAAQHGKCVSFMPKVFADEVGSSCHVHVSVWEKAANRFWDAGKNAGSTYFRQFLGGLLRYSRELSYFFAPTINSYKRYQAQSWAPTRMAWAFDNRTTGFRVVGHGNSFRIENRMPGGDANPYLAFAAMIAAGLAGVEEGLDCGDVYHGNAYADPNLPALPSTLREAADLLAASKLARQAFGDEVVDFYVLTARHEVRAFDRAVTDWERMRYFEQM
jgi:glutamine synthetase